jgi:hypothetical protein
MRCRAAHLALLVAALSAAPAMADDLRNARREAVASQAADLATTAAGLALGAVETNPLGVLLVVPKVVGFYRIKAAPTTEQPALWSAYQAFGWGAAANNVCVIAAIASGGPAIVPCAVVGAAVGAASWAWDAERRQRDEFEEVCDSAKALNPDTVCTYTPAQP